MHWQDRSSFLRLSSPSLQRDDREAWISPASMVLRDARARRGRRGRPRTRRARPPGALPAVRPPGAPFVAHRRLSDGDAHVAAFAWRHRQQPFPPGVAEIDTIRFGRGAVGMSRGAGASSITGGQDRLQPPVLIFPCHVLPLALPGSTRRRLRSLREPPGATPDLGEGWAAPAPRRAPRSLRRPRFRGSWRRPS